MKKMSLALCATLLLSQPSLASQGINSEFNNTYRAYLAAIEKHEDATELAKKAYTLGQKVYGENAENTANLAINYANTLPENKQQERFELFKYAYDILAKNHGKLSNEVYDSLFGLAHSTKSPRLAFDYLEDAIEIATIKKDHKLVADSKLKAARILAYKPSGGRYFTAKAYLEEADEYYRNNIPENSVERIEADFLVAAFAEHKKNYEQAIERLTHVVTVFDEALSFDHKAELDAHSKLVHLYEKVGKREEATKHCVAIAKMVPWKDSQEQEPLYRVNPKYPLIKAQRGQSGSVVMEFEVTPSGFVDKITVIESKGGGAFETEAKRAVEQWRYAPKFENGQAIAATSRVQLDFKINR